MMIKYIKDSEIDIYIKLMNALYYKEVKRNKVPFEELTRVKFKSEKNDEEITSLRRSYLPLSTPPFFLVILFVVLAIIFATAFLILNIANLDINQMLFFFVLMIPAFIFMLSATFISFRRYFATLKNIERFAYIVTLEKKMNKDE